MSIEFSKLKLTREITRDDIKSTIAVYDHQCGGRVIRIKNNDPEKFFCAVFRTSVSDSTGVPHILEHSVLSGSKKYPISDPFVTLLKTSMPTFLNAMTYPDKTLYPVGSANFQDFCNLSDVYLDTCFNPLLTRETFEREGWRYEIVDGQLKFQGVVFNEMKGVFSDVERYVVDDGLLGEIYDDNEYHFCSGGDPLEIPNLTYEKYKQFFDDKYHPANSIIMVYGSMTDEEENKVLTNINSYLDKFEKSVLLPAVKTSKEFKARKHVNKTYQSNKGDTNLYSNIVYRMDSTLEGTIMSLILEYYLNDTRDCYKELMNTGVIERFVNVGVENDLIQPYFLLASEVKNLEDSKLIQSIFEKHIQKSIAEGFDQEYIQGLVNKMEYAFIESLDNNGFGIINEFARRFGKNEEFLDINYYDVIDEVKAVVLIPEKLKEFLSKTIIDNKNVLICDFTPDLDFNKNREEVEKQKLESIYASMSEKDKESILTMNKKVQQGIVEDESVIPRLSIESLPKNIEKYELNITKTPSINLITSSDLTKQTSHLSFLFQVNPSFDISNIYYLDLIFSKFFDFGTKNHNSEELEKILKNTLGSYASNINLRMDGRLIGSISISYLNSKQDSVGDIIMDLMDSRNFNEPELLANLIANSLGHLQYTIKNESEEIIAEQLNRKVYDTNYYEYYSLEAQEKALLAIQDQLKTDPDKLVTKLNEVYSSFLLGLSLSASYLGQSKTPASIIELSTKLSKKLNTTPFVPSKMVYKLIPFDNNLIEYNSSDIVNFHRQVVEVDQLDENPGYLYLMCRIASFDYLWTEVRSKGGAYGVRLSYLENPKLLTAFTYRDPRGVENLNFVEDALKYLSALAIDEVAFESYKIATINSYNPYRNTESQFYNLTKNYYSDLNSIEHVNKVYNQIKNCTQEDIRSIAQNILNNKTIMKAVSYKLK
jgi:presequence protease